MVKSFVTEHRMPLVQATGVEAGLNTQQQLLIALTHIVSQGGASRMRDINAAVEQEVNKRGFTLSRQGQDTLRELVNRNAVRRGWIHPSEGQNNPWRITQEGQEYVEASATKSDGANLVNASRRPDNILPEEVTTQVSFVEGAIRTIAVNAFERSAKGRLACLRHYGVSCTVCSFNFEDNYGPAAANLIHVHHLSSLASIGGEYELDPIADLRPVCPNCHAVIHRREPPFTLDEIRAMLSAARGKEV